MALPEPHVAPPRGEVRLTLAAKKTYTAGKGGTLHVRFIDNVANIMVDGRKVGEVSSLVGGGVEIECAGDHYTIGALDIWAAFQAARDVEPPPAALAALTAIASEALAAWDSDQDSRVGKMLAALAGRLPGYRADIDRLRAALICGPDVATDQSPALSKALEAGTTMVASEWQAAQEWRERFLAAEDGRELPPLDNQLICFLIADCLSYRELHEEVSTIRNGQKVQGR